MEFIEQNQSNNNNMAATFDDNFIDGFFDCSFINDVTSTAFSLVHSSSVDIDFSQAGSVPQEQESQKQFPKQRYNIDIDFSQAVSMVDELDFENELPKKRGRTDAFSKPKTKACRERERREKLNESFLGLSSILEPGRIAKSDKLAILNDAIVVVKKLRTEAEEHKEENRRLQEEIESLKAEKNELREEKLALKAAKVKMEQQLKAIPVSSPGLVPSYPTPYQAGENKMGGLVPSYPTPYHAGENKMAGLVPSYPTPYHAGENKMGIYPSYGMYPMWHYLPQSIRDTSRDHVLRPPAA